MAKQLELGRRFQVAETRDFIDGTEHVARFRQHLSYSVTERNRVFVQKMIDDGVARLEASLADGGGMKVTAAHAHAVGNVSVGKPQKGK